MSLMSGSLRAILLFDIAEEIDLAILRKILGTGPSKREPAFRHPDELVRECGTKIAQIVRGEEIPLSGAERQEVLQSSMSFAPDI